MPFTKGHIHRFAFLATVLLSLLAFLPSAFAGIVVRGNRRVDSETIRSYFASTSSDDVNKGVKELYATGLFSDVKVSGGGGNVVITVNENRAVNRVVFEGASKVKPEQLETELSTKTRGSYSQTLVNADIERIKDVYRRSGRAAASVTARTIPLSNGTVDVVFTINEGEKTGIKQINFVGNHAYSGGKLRDLMDTTEMNYLSFFKSSDVYDPEKIGNDLELIRRFYLKNGYADFRVTGSDARFDPAKKGYIVTITVEEGPQYKVGSVNVDSHVPALSNASLLPLVRLHVGQTYNGDLVEKTVETMTREVNRRGFAFSQVKPRGDRDPTTRTVSIVFTVEDGPRVYIESIIIRGNTRTRDYVIRREFELGEGDPYNKVLVDKAERRLNGLGFFKKVKITNEAGSAADRVVIVVNVEDQPTGSVSVSGGYSTVDGFIGEVAVTETNFLGRGQYVRAAITAGQRTRGAEFNFTEPYFLGRRLAAGFDLFAKETDVSQYSFYNNFVLGGTLRLGIPLTDELTFSPRYSVYRSEISIPNNASTPYNDCNSPIYGTTPGPSNQTFPVYGTAASTLTYNCLTNGEASLALKQAVGTTVTSLFGYTLSYNSIDNVKSPTGGILAEFRQDVAGAGGTEHFLRSTGDVRYYHAIYDQIIGIVHLQGGDIRQIGSGQLRIVDNFNLGPSLVRGFAPNGIGPRDVSAGVDPTGNPLGGTEYAGASVETQFPLYGVPRDLGLKGAAFFDAGTLFGYHGQTDFSGGTGAVTFGATNPATGVTYYGQSNSLTLGADSTRIRTAAGVSLIWNSPLGPLRFDFAKAITKAQGDQTQFFRFSGGATF